MEKIAVEDVEQYMTAATVMRPLSRALGTTELALNYFEVEPGGAFSIGYHTHEDQEEVIYVLSGTATWETEDGETTVSEGEVVRFPAGEFQHGYNEGPETVVALGLGAPEGSEDVLVECPECGARVTPHMEMTDAEDAITVDCPACDARVARLT